MDELLESVASEVPSPGGGSVAALAAAMAAALVSMVARASRDAWPEAAGVAAQAGALRRRLAELAEIDAEAYEEALVALQLPRALEPEVRNATIGLTLGRAADVPLAIAEAAADVAELGALTAEEADPNLRGDAVAAAVIGESAARAAANLVRVNLTTTEGDERVVLAGTLAQTAADAASRALAVGP